MKHVYTNRNPKGVITSDCVVQALSWVMGGYENALRELNKRYEETGYHITCRVNYGALLINSGYEYHEKPKQNGKTIKLREFKNIMDEYEIDTDFLIRAGRWHIVYASNGHYYDIDNSGHLVVDGYYVYGKRTVRSVVK